MSLDKTLAGVDQNNLLYDSLLELNQFDGSPSDFLKKLIHIKRLIIDAKNGALVKIRTEGACGLIAASPPVKDGKLPPWLGQAISDPKKLLETNGVHCKFVEETADGRKMYIVYQPLKADANDQGIELYSIIVKDINELNIRLQRLQTLMPYYDFYEGKLQLQDFRDRTNRLHQAFDVMIKLNTHDSFLGSLMALCNELSARWSCSRVSVGLVKGRHLKLKAMSNSEKFNRKMALTRDLASMMEECADQDLEVLYPQEGSGIYVCRQAQHFSNTHGPLSLLCVPLRREGKVFGVLCFERDSERPFSSSEVEIFRLVADLFTPRLENLKKQSRWLGLRILDGFRKAFSLFVGVKYTWVKIIIFLVLGVSYWLTQAKTMYQVEASFSFESQSSLSVSAPFNGEINEIYVKNGQYVEIGGRLFSLDTIELKLKLRELQSKRLQALKKAAVALREGEAAEEQIARAEAEGMQAEIDLVEYSIKRMVVKAKMSGTVVADELEKKQFSSVELGTGILEIVEADKLKATLYVPEDQIADVTVGQVGELVAAGYPDNRIAFEILEIEKVARVVEQKNVYRVRADIKPGEHKGLMRAGMEGVARIDVDEQLLVWVWTRKAVNWVRMKLWF